MQIPPCCKLLQQGGIHFHPPKALLRFPVQGVFPKPRAIFSHFQPLRMGPFVFCSRIVPVTCLRTGQRNHDPHTAHLIHSSRCLPACFSDPGNLPFVGQFPEYNAGYSEFPQIAARTAGQGTAVMKPCRRRIPRQFAECGPVPLSDESLPSCRIFPNHHPPPLVFHNDRFFSHSNSLSICAKLYDDCKKAMLPLPPSSSQNIRCSKPGALPLA